MPARHHTWRRQAVTIEDAGQGVTITVRYQCSRCRGECTASKRVRPPAAAAKAFTFTSSAADAGAPTDEAAQALAALGFRQADIARLLKGVTGTTEERIAAALQRNGS